MPVYPHVGGHRFGYDIDGSQVFWDNGGALTPFDLAGRQQLNNESDNIAFDGPGTVTVLFPRQRNLWSFYINAWSDPTTPADPYDVTVEVSSDTTTGSDGTWMAWGSPVHCHPTSVRPGFRTDTVTPSTNVDVIAFRVHLPNPGAGSTAILRALHLYGFDFTPSDGTWMDVAETAGPALEVSLPQGDTMYFEFGATPSSGATMSNYKVTVEALTNPAGKSLADQCLVSDVGFPCSFQAQNGPENTPPTTHDLIIAAAYDADLGGPWCVRVRGEADGILPGVVYIYIDEVTASLPQHPTIVSVLPDTSLIAGTSAVTVKARGVGSSQADRAVALQIGDNSSSFLSSPITATSWTFIGPSAHAYDGSRKMSETQCDPDHYEITFTVPPEVLGLTNAYFKMVIPDLSSLEDSVGSLTSELNLSILSTAYLSGSSAASDTSAGGVVMLRQPAQPIDFDPTQYGYDPAELLDTALYPPTPMVQRHFARTRAPYAVVDGLAVDPPILGAMSKSVAFARSWSPTMDLGDQIALGLMGATARWLPDTADITGGDTWHPHFGSAPNFTFSPLGLTPPYVDPDYDYYARYEKLKHVGAMVFDGGSWATFGGPSAQAGFSWVIVVVLHHPANRSHYDILASPSTATDPDRATDATLRYDHGWLRSYGGARLSSTLLTPPTYKGRIRPVILAWSEGPKGGTLGVVGGLGRHWQDYAHPNRSSYDLRMKLGQNGSVDDPSYAAEMDVLDVMYWNTRLTRSAFAPVVTKLDGVYGVSDR